MMRKGHRKKRWKKGKGLKGGRDKQGPGLHNEWERKERRARQTREKKLTPVSAARAPQAAQPGTMQAAGRKELDLWMKF